MNHLGTQRLKWKFSTVDLQQIRQQTNRDFCSKHGLHIPEQQWANFFLTPKEEMQLTKFYEQRLLEFCKKFQPAMPKAVMGTAMHYFKRFYINNSLMDYHPKQILVTCVYLATKVEEFNVSLNQFVGNVRGDRAKATDIILNNELLLMQKMDYNLAVHNPFRPLEGFLIEIKTRYPDYDSFENWRKTMEEFIDRLFLTDAILVAAPSQLALMAMVYASRRMNEAELMDRYLEHLFPKPELLASFNAGLLLIMKMTQEQELSQKDPIKKKLEKKLELCRNQENNPDSEVYKQKMKDMMEQDEMEQDGRVLQHNEYTQRIKEMFEPVEIEQDDKFLQHKEEQNRMDEEMFYQEPA